MRILICNWKDLRHPGAGGAEVYTHECARRWAAAGHEVTLFCAAVDETSSLDATDGYLIVRRRIEERLSRFRPGRSEAA